MRSNASIVLLRLRLGIHCLENAPWHSLTLSNTANSLWHINLATQRSKNALSLIRASSMRSGASNVLLRLRVRLNTCKMHAFHWSCDHVPSLHHAITRSCYHAIMLSCWSSIGSHLRAISRLSHSSTSKAHDPSHTCVPPDEFWKCVKFAACAHARTQMPTAHAHKKITMWALHANLHAHTRFRSVSGCIHRHTALCVRMGGLRGVKCAKMHHHRIVKINIHAHMHTKNHNVSATCKSTRTHTFQRCKRMHTSPHCALHIRVGISM